MKTASSGDVAVRLEIGAEQVVEVQEHGGVPAAASRRTAWFLSVIVTEAAKVLGVLNGLRGHFIGGGHSAGEGGLVQRRILAAGETTYDLVQARKDGDRIDVERYQPQRTA